MNELQKMLFDLQDESYREFHARLIPEIPKERIIGVRTPQLRAFARRFTATAQAQEFLCCLPHHYYEENNLHAELICLKEKEITSLFAATERFLPYIDNWATCDMFSPKLFGKNPMVTEKKARVWLQSDHCFTCRFGIVTLMRWNLGEHFDPEILEDIVGLRREEYYVNMAIAWFFSMALVKQPQAAMPYILGEKLSPWVHNKTIQKAIESRQISDEQKRYLRSLKIVL